MFHIFIFTLTINRTSRRSSMARTKHTALQRTCPICLQPPGLAAITCIKCDTVFHATCVDWSSPRPFMCLDCNNSDQYFVKSILDHRSQNNERQFMVEWYHDSPTWEPESNLGNCLALLRSYIAANNLEPTSVAEPPCGPVGSSWSRPTNNWITTLRVKVMIEKWSAKIPQAYLDLPVTIVNKDKLDYNRDQLLIVKHGNHCFIGLLVVESSTSTVIHIGDGNNLYYRNVDLRKAVNEVISPLLGWCNVKYIAAKANLGARRDLCGAAGVIIGIGFLIQYNIAFKYRVRILSELNATLDSHHDQHFTPPMKGPKCYRCGKGFNTRVIRNHEKFCKP